MADKCLAKPSQSLRLLLTVVHCNSRGLHEENQLRFGNSKHFLFFIYFAKNHEIGSLVVRKVEKSWESRQNRTVSLDQFGSPRAVADLLVMFIAWTSQKDLFCLKVDRSANLNPSKSTWGQLIVLWNVQNQNLTSKALGREIKRNSCDLRQATS